MAVASRNLGCRFEESGHSRVVIFEHAGGEEVFILPAERLDPATLEKLRAGTVHCGVEGPASDGTSSLHLKTPEGELLYQQKVWIRSATWARMRET